MARHYPAELRRRTCERMLAGEPVKDLVAELSISEHTLYRWRHQALVDAGQRPGAKSCEALEEMAVGHQLELGGVLGQHFAMAGAVEKAAY